MAQGVSPAAGGIRVSDRFLRWQAAAWAVVADGADRVADAAGRILLGAPGGGSARDASESVLSPAPPQQFELFAGVAAENGRTADLVAILARQAERVSRAATGEVEHAGRSYRREMHLAERRIDAAGRVGGHT